MMTLKKCLLGLSYLDLEDEIFLPCFRTNFPLSDSISSAGTGSRCSSESDIRQTGFQLKLATIICLNTLSMYINS